MKIRFKFTPQDRTFAARFEKRIRPYVNSSSVFTGVVGPLDDGSFGTGWHIVVFVEEDRKLYWNLQKIRSEFNNAYVWCNNKPSVELDWEC